MWALGNEWMGFLLCCWVAAALWLLSVILIGIAHMAEGDGCFVCACVFHGGNSDDVVSIPVIMSTAAVQFLNFFFLWII